MGFCFISHKVMRWLTPFFIIFAMISNAFLLEYHPLYNFIFAGQLALLSIPFVDWILRRLTINIKLFRFITHFYGMNVALLAGFIKFLRGVKTSVWKPTERNQ
jgi:hypothetical protein